MITITDVAREADVSIATVSRVLNNSLQVMPETRRRVLAAAKKLGYELSPRKAAALTAPRLILVITNTTIVSINNNITKAAAACGYQAIFNIYRPDDEQHILQLLDQSDICGIIFCCAYAPGPGLRQAMAAYPVVELSSNVLTSGNIYRVIADETAMSFDAVSHLIRTGCKHIGMLSTMSTLPVTVAKQRQEGYVKALAAAADTKNTAIDNSTDDQKPQITSPTAPQPTPQTAPQPMPQTVPQPTLQTAPQPTPQPTTQVAPHIVYGDYTCDGGYHAARQLLADDPQCDGIFCCCDMMAMGCLNYLHEAHIPVPGRISVISLDNMEASEYTIPPLSTVDAGYFESALEAVNLLDGILEKKYSRGRTIHVGHQLILRKTTKA